MGDFFLEQNESINAYDCGYTLPREKNKNHRFIREKTLLFEKVIFGSLGQKKGAMIEIAARINPISYEKPYYKRLFWNFSL